MGRTATTVVLIAALLGLTAAPSEAAERYAGPDRIATAAAVSRVHWGTATEVLLARADDWPDALAAAPLAAQVGAPLLLTAPGALPSIVADELRRLRPSTVTVLGGPAAVSDAVVAEVGALRPGLVVRRVAGADRYETAAALFGNRPTPAEVVLASGESFPEALVAAGLRPAQMLLTRPDGLPPSTLAPLRQPSAARVTIVGDNASVSPAVERVLGAEGLTVRRIGAGDRYALAREVVRDALSTLPPTGVPLIVATGEDFPDALGAGALAARVSAPILLVSPGGLPPATVQFLQQQRLRFGVVKVLGGDAAVPASVVAEVEAALG